MSRLARASGLAIVSALASLVAVGPASACGGATQQTAKVRSITVEQLASVLQNHPNVSVLDANGTDTRTRYGVIPGARLLSSFATYDPGKELPTDKGTILVFYCMSERCSAAPTAAERALAAGYTNVFVLDAGIKGWTEAGHATRRIPVTTAST
jgi:rhodanese-related sulfurtransferase